MTAVNGSKSCDQAAPVVADTKRAIAAGSKAATRVGKAEDTARSSDSHMGAMIQDWTICCPGMRARPPAVEQSDVRARFRLYTDPYRMLDWLRGHHLFADQ